MTTARPWVQHYAPGVRNVLEYPETPLFRLLDQTAMQHPDLNALDFYGRKLTYRQLLGAANKCANALIARGLQPGDRVALMMPNCPQYVIAYFGVLKAGGVVAQVNPLYVEREIEYLCSNAGARFLITVDLLYPKAATAVSATPVEKIFVARLKGDLPLGPDALSFEAELEGAPHTDPGVAVSPRSLAVLQYTGGTTGVSKGAMLTHANLIANIVQTAESLQPVRLPPGQERILTILPLFHVYGMTVCMNYAIYMAAELILLPKFEMQEVLDTIKRTQPTALPGVPTMYVALNAHPKADEYGVASIRICNSGAAPMPAEVMKRFEERFHATVIEGYGLSEASPVTHCNPIVGQRKAGSVGLAYPDVDCKIVDVETGTRELGPNEVGELIIRGPQVMAGYWQMPEETKKALREYQGETWLFTGDLCQLDEEGYLFVTDRKKDMIIAGGYNIYPREVEEVIYLHPAVSEVVVAGVPDAYRGETVKAYVVTKPGQSLSASELEVHCRKNLAAFKVPRVYEFRENLPKSAIGKLLRRVLVDEEKRKQEGQGA